ncbi:MAG: UvrD-helicase domain-containing protein [bacterium]|nr:UvrD-helicase domain-containing protein [bacterium]
MWENKNYTLFKASAGSGKTYTIAKEFIEFVLNNPEEIKNILAVTFTNKAAYEMKERILEFLKGLAGFDELVSQKRKDSIENFRNEIKKDLNLKEDEIEKRSKKCLELILYSKYGRGYSDFSVMTIDSFTNKLVKVFSEELEISPSYDIGFNIKNIIKKSIDLLISKVSENGEDGKYLKEILLEYLIYRNEEGKSLNIEREIFDTVNSIRDKEKNFNKSIEIKKFDFNEIRKILRSLKDFKKDFIDRCRKIYEIKVDCNFFKNQSKSLVGQIKSFVERVQIGDDDLFYLISKKTFKDFYSDNDFNINKIIKENSQIERVTLQELEGKLKEFHTFLKEKLEDFIYDRIYVKNIYSNILYEKIDEIIKEYQKSNDIVFIDELNIKIKELFKNGDVPFIYFRIGEKYKKFLIDEFQDTSTVQWENLKPLIENGISENYECVLVGDDKQAIYRFRGGSTKIIKNFENESYTQTKNLKDNFRSEENIVSFNNLFFSDIDREIGGEHVYKKKNVEQNSKKKGDGYVEINFIEHSLEEEILNKGKLINIIEDCLKRGYKQSSISILVRRKEEGSKIAEILSGIELNSQKIKILSAETLLIKNNPYVFFIVSLLKFSIYNSLEDFSNILYLWKDMDVEKSKFKEAEEKFLYQIKNVRNKRYDYDDILKRLWGEEIFKEYNEKIKRSLNFLTPYEIISKILEIIINRLVKDYSDSVPHILKLLDESYRFGKDGGLVDFLDYYDEYRDELVISSPLEIDAITISTIHKSKGLEYDVVIVPFANWDGFRKLHNSYFIEELKKNTIALKYGDIKRELENYFEGSKFLEEKNDENRNIFYDDLNLLYVSLTRAKSELYVFTEKMELSKDNKKSNEKIDVKNLINKKVQNIEVLKKEEGKLFLGNKVKINYKESVEKIDNLKRINICSHEKDIFLDRSLQKIINVEREYENVKRGEILHKILSFIYTKNDVDRALDLGLNEGFFCIDEKNEYRKLLEGVVNDKTLSKFFKDDLKIYNEKDIVFEGKIFRPDRIVFDGKDCYIVDYKTGIEDKKHIEQVKRYMDFFKKKNFSVKGYLFYTDSMKVVEVKDEVS